MEIGPIFRALFHNKARFWLIALEIALTLAIVVNCLNMILDQRAKMVRPTGIDVDNILVVQSEPFAPEFKDENYVHASYEDDLRALRAVPGVRHAAGTSAIPLSGSGSSTGRRPLDSEEESPSMPYFVVSDDIIDTLGVELLEGRKFVAEDFPTRDEEEAIDEGSVKDTRNVILTKSAADRLFPDGDALGQQITTKSGYAVNTIVGIVKQMHGSWPLSSVAERVMLYPGPVASERRSRYLVRVEPGMLDSLFTTLEEEMLRVNEGRLISVRTLTEIKSHFYRDLTAVNTLLGGVSVLLVLVTSLGVVGLTAFSVTERRRQIGTRRALGATRLQILRYFLVENWLISGVGLVLGVGLTYGLNFLLANIADTPTIGFPLVLGGMILLWLVGLLAAVVPAARGTTVSPSTATQTV